jgi:hypothetical protein
MLTRVQVTSKVTLSHTFRVDEALTDAAAGVTVTVKRLDGTAVGAGSASAVSLGIYSFALPVSAVPDTWTVDWSGTFSGALVVVRDIVEHCGDFYFGLAEVRAEYSLAASKYPTATLAQKRIEVEMECDDITRRAFVPRFKRRLLDGSGTPELIVPDLYLRNCSAASVATYAGQTMTPLTASDLAALAAQPEGVIIRDDGQNWPEGHRNVIVEYTHGEDYAPETIRSGSKLRLRTVLDRAITGVPQRAISFTTPDGGIYRLSSPGKTTTGQPEVDGLYGRLAEPRVWIA